MHKAYHVPTYYSGSAEWQRGARLVSPGIATCGRSFTTTSERKSCSEDALVSTSSLWCTGWGWRASRGISKQLSKVSASSLYLVGVVCTSIHI
jgi:hypothetical protein